MDKLWSCQGLVVPYLRRSRATRKGLSSLILLTVRELWNERNAKVFRNEASMPGSILSRIKGSANLWATAGIKHLSAILLRE
jgi:hypothetical protein